MHSESQTSDSRSKPESNRTFDHTIGHLPRLLPRTLKVCAFGFYGARQEWIETRADGVVFSFIVNGWGMFHENGQACSVAGPCVLLQRPGCHYSYGPFSEWEEFFVTYRPEAWALFEATPWAAMNRPVLQLDNPRLLEQCAQRMLAIGGNLGVCGTADRIDLLFEELLLEVLLTGAGTTRTERNERLYAARAWIEQHAVEAMRLEDVARNHGMAPCTFRRLWRERFDTTPSAFLNALRMHRAKSLLAGTDLPIATVAARAGIADPLHFARWFRKNGGMTPHDYRASGRSRLRDSGQVECRRTGAA